MVVGSCKWPHRIRPYLHYWPSWRVRKLLSPSCAHTPPHSRMFSCLLPAEPCAMAESPLSSSETRSALFELTMTRLREFLREPEAVFWTFGFPLLLAAGLGIAFRSRAPESLRVGVVDSAPSAALLINALKTEPRLLV